MNLAFLGFNLAMNLAFLGFNLATNKRPSFKKVKVSVWVLVH
jgi:hypothetical protein